MKSCLFLFSIILIVLPIAVLSSGNIVINFAMSRVEAAGPQQADIYDLFVNTPISSETRENLVGNYSIDDLRSFVGTFQNFTNSTQSNFPSIPQQNVTIYYDFQRLPALADGQIYELLMLSFTNSSSAATLADFQIDYTAKVNGSGFNFGENGSTLTGADLKVISSLSPANASSIDPANYSVTIDILKIEKTVPLKGKQLVS